MIKDLCTLVRYHVFKQKHLSKDVFSIDSEVVLSAVQSYPNRRNIELGLKYAGEKYLIPIIGEYLEGKIEQWDGYRQESLIREAEVFNRGSSQMQRGVYRSADGNRQQSERERERINNQVATIARYRVLLHVVKTESIVSYLWNLEYKPFRL